MTSRNAGIHVRLQPEVEQQLRVAARERMVSVSLLAGFLIEDGLDHLIPIDEIRRTHGQERSPDG